MKTLTRSDVAVGDELPAVDVPVTATLIVAGAIASRDYQDVHHDREVAKQRGVKDIFMNILTTNGIVGRYVTDWSGPEAILRGVSIRLGAPNYAGDTMHLEGRVAAIEAEDIVVEVRGTNAIGEHVSGTVRLRLPAGGTS